MAVTFFFVLSGFLITLLLLRERDCYGSISIRSFYVRRILRIWPVYYLCLLIGLFGPPLLQTLPYPPPTFDTSSASLPWHVALFPNIANSENPLCIQAWSIGVEEQFYLVWPWLFVCFCRTPAQMIATIACVVITVLGCRSAHLVSPNAATHFLNSLLARSRFDNMAVGALFALAFYRDMLPRGLRIASIVWAVVCVLRWRLTVFPFGLDHLVYSFLFGATIYYVVVHTTDRNVLEWPPLRFLGRVSYGIYMYHVMAIYIVLNLMASFASNWLPDSPRFELVAHAASAALTVAFAALSYYGIESRCLHLKAFFGASTRAPTQ